MWANGIIEYGRKAFKPPKECGVDKPTVTKTRSLTVFDLASAFLILVVGFSPSTFCFVMKIFKYVFLLAQSKGRKSKINTPITEVAK